MGTFFPCCSGTRSPNGSNGDFPLSSFYSRTTDNTNAIDSAAVHHATTSRVNRSSGGGAGRRAQRRAFSLR